MVEYTYQDSKWQMGNTSCCYENYVLKDEIIGTWQTCIEASHPMHVDSYMTLHLSKIDDSNCEYDFYWTSRIPGGRDQSFRGTYTIKPVMDENIFLDHLVIGYDNANGYIIINNEGIVFKPVASTNEYILYKN